MSALYRCVLLSRVSKLKQQTGLTRVRTFAHTQWKTCDCLVRAGNTAIPQTTTILNAMAKKTRNVGLSRSLSLSSSSDDAKARVKRVSIEGNIGKSNTAVHNKIKHLELSYD